MPARKHRKAPPAASCPAVELPEECMDAIIQHLPPNCIPLSIRQVSKEYRLRYLQHTTVQVTGNGFLPVWALLAALPQLNENQQSKVLEALARRGDLEGMKQLVQQPDLPYEERAEAALEVAAGLGHLDIVQWMEQELGCSIIMDWEELSCVAAAGGHLHVLQWFRAQHPDEEWTYDVCLAAAGSGDVQTLEYVRRHCDDEWDPNIWCPAARSGRVAMLQCLHDSGCPWDAEACAAAAEAGHVEALQHLRAIGCPWVPARMWMAAVECGDARMLRWLHEAGCPWDERIWKWAAKAGKVEVLKFCRDRGCPISDGVDLCAAAAAFDEGWSMLDHDAARRGRQEVLLWLRERGDVWSAGTFAAAATTGDVQLLRWLREQQPPCPWDACTVLTLVDYAWRIGCAECLQYVLSEGCPWDKQAYKMARQDCRLQHIVFPTVRRSQRKSKK